MLRTYTDGRYTTQQPPPAYVMAMLCNAINADELQAAARAAMAVRPSPPLTLGQAAVLEAVRGFDDE